MGEPTCKTPDCANPVAFAGHCQDCCNGVYPKDRELARLRGELEEARRERDRDVEEACQSLVDAFEDKCAATLSPERYEMMEAWLSSIRAPAEPAKEGGDREDAE